MGDSKGSSQTLGPWKCPVAYLSKRLDYVAAGWPNCLRALASFTKMAVAASKLTLGQDLQLVDPHSVEALLQSPPDRWLSNARLTQYQALLLDPPQIEFLKTTALNPATLLPDDDPSEPLHNCLEVLESLQNLQPDLTDIPWPNPDEVLYTDASSYICNGVRSAGAAVVTQDQVVWAQALGHGTSAQKAELIALRHYGTERGKQLISTLIVCLCNSTCTWDLIPRKGTTRVRRKRNKKCDRNSDPI